MIPFAYYAGGAIGSVFAIWLLAAFFKLILPCSLVAPEEEEPIGDASLLERTP